MNRVLTTGGTSFLGSHLCDRLLRAGAQYLLGARSAQEGPAPLSYRQHAADTRGDID